MTWTPPDITYSAPKELEARLLSADVTVEDVYQFLDGQQLWLIDHNQGAPAPMDFFKGEADLESFRQACAWWPKDAPKMNPCPNLLMLTNSYHNRGTFAERLAREAAPVIKWLQDSKRDVAQPNAPKVSSTERSRKARGESAESAAAYREYIEACQQRKAADLVWATRCGELLARHIALKKASG